MQKPIRVGLVEGREQDRLRLAALIGGGRGLALEGAWESVEEALPAVTLGGPEVLLLGIQTAGVAAIDGVRLLKERSPLLEVLLLAVHADREQILAAIHAGACGCLLQDTPSRRLLAALRELHAGGAPMSPGIARLVVDTLQRAAAPRQAVGRLSARELEVLQQLAAGDSYKTAARALGLAEDTVRFHVRHIYEKLDVHSKSEAVLRACRDGLLD